MTVAEIKDLVAQVFAAVGGYGAALTLVFMIWRTIMNGRSNKLMKANTLATTNLFDQFKEWFATNVTGKIRVNVSAQLNKLSDEIRAEYIEKEEKLMTVVSVQNELLKIMTNLMLESPKVSKDERIEVLKALEKLDDLTDERYLNPKSVCTIEVAEYADNKPDDKFQADVVANSSTQVDMVQV